MGKFLKRLFITLIVMLLIIGGAAWWFLSYISPDKPLNLNYNPIDVRQKAVDMVKRLKPELVLSEAEVNDLIKKHIDRDVAEGVELDGAEFELNGDRLIADLNITYKDRIPAHIRAEYRLEWQNPNLALRPQSLTMKGIQLPLRMLETIVVPLDLPTGDMVTVDDVKFEEKQVKVLFQIKLPF
ncbi:hypothetical protein D3P07_23040 [Paenibacillus sp. 1011MAR3C5]|uniref:hypothetical protein n=1 Tax=Paenibacillus sp. 1011MAR3C5 TaxID=1675787 RepID=UPI000E6B5E5A|nr:hypothetical protein [Paenibacillus sp. 1011MAR3C5]RJE84249.1 hypothetical protein D3P07_23040 [Paenibacillus sp. 1011MAR3C5]